MQKKLTITVDEEVHNGLHKVIGPGEISKFIEGLVHPHVVRPNLEAEHALMSQDEEREGEVLEWAEATFGDMAIKKLRLKCGGEF